MCMHGYGWARISPVFPVRVQMDTSTGSDKSSWLSPAHLTSPAVPVHISRNYNFQELSRPQNQYFPYMPILSNCGYSFLTGFGNAWGLWIHSWSWNSRVSTALCPG